MFDTHDAITFAHEGLSTPCGDVRLIPQLRGLTRLAGQRALAGSDLPLLGVENREASLRYVPGSELLDAGHANVELKVSDASANPYLALARWRCAGPTRPGQPTVHWMTS